MNASTTRRRHDVSHGVGAWLFVWLVAGSAACSKAQPAATDPSATPASPAAAPSAPVDNAAVPAKPSATSSTAPQAVAAAQAAPATAPTAAPIAEHDAEGSSAAHARTSGKVTDERCRVGGPTLPDGAWFGAVFTAERDHIVFDVMCLFTGDDARRAIVEDTRRGLPPGAMTYIRNRSLRTRNVAVAATATVVWLTAADGTHTQRGSYPAWLELRDKHGYSGPPVTIEVAQGKVQRIVEQAGEDGLGEVVAAAELGSGPNELAVEWGDEARTLGPTSIAVSWDERQIYVLDTAGEYVAVFEDGHLVNRIAVPKNNLVDDLGVLPNGHLVLMDRGDQGRLFVIDGKGALIKNVPLRDEVTPGEDYPGVLEMSRDGAWICMPETDTCTRFLDRDGNVDPARPSVHGTPLLDGKRLLRSDIQGKKGPQVLQLSVCERTDPACARTAKLKFAHFTQVVGCDGGDSGRLSVVTLHIWGVSESRRSEQFISMLTPDLKLEHQFRTPTAGGGLDAWRVMVVGPSGAVYLLDGNAWSGGNGIVVRRYR